MKWYRKEKHWENYKGEKFTGRMAKTLEVDDSFEAVNSEGKKVNKTVKEKIETEKGGLIVVMEEVIVNG